MFPCVNPQTFCSILPIWLVFRCLWMRNIFRTFRKFPSVQFDYEARISQPIHTECIKMPIRSAEYFLLLDCLALCNSRFIWFCRIQMIRLTVRSIGKNRFGNNEYDGKKKQSPNANKSLSAGIHSMIFNVFFSSSYPQSIYLKCLSTFRISHFLPL